MSITTGYGAYDAERDMWLRQQQMSAAAQSLLGLSGVYQSQSAQLQAWHQQPEPPRETPTNPVLLLLGDDE